MAFSDDVEKRRTPSGELRGRCFGHCGASRGDRVDRGGEPGQRGVDREWVEAQETDGCRSRSSHCLVNGRQRRVARAETGRSRDRTEGHGVMRTAGEGFGGGVESRIGPDQARRTQQLPAKSP